MSILAGTLLRRPFCLQVPSLFLHSTCVFLSIFHSIPSLSIHTYRLIEEVLGPDTRADRVPMEKVVMIIWQFREDPQVVKFMTRFVAKVR